VVGGGEQKKTTKQSKTSGCGWGYLGLIRGKLEDKGRVPWPVTSIERIINCHWGFTDRSRTPVKGGLAKVFDIICEKGEMGTGRVAESDFRGDREI